MTGEASSVGSQARRGSEPQTPQSYAHSSASSPKPFPLAVAAIPVITALGLILSPTFRSSAYWMLPATTIFSANIWTVFNYRPWGEYYFTACKTCPEWSRKSEFINMAVGGILQLLQGTLQIGVQHALSSVFVLTPAASMPISIAVTAIAVLTLAHFIYLRRCPYPGYAAFCLASGLISSIGSGIAMAKYGPIGWAAGTLVPRAGIFLSIYASFAKDRLLRSDPVLRTDSANDA